MLNHELIVPKAKELPKKLAGDPLGSPNISMIIGQTGSGKSVVTANLLMALQKRHEFEDGLFVTGNNRDPILDSIEIPVATTPGELSDYITNLKQAKEGTNHVLILDDIQGSPDFNIMAGRSEFVKFMLSHRHFGEDPKKRDRNGTWVIMTAQTLKNSYTPQIRSQIKNLFLFYPSRSPQTNLKAYEELAQDPVQMKRAMAILKTKGKHAFIFLNKHDPERDRYFLGFNEELKDLN